MRSIKRLTNLLISRNPKKQNYENNKIYSEEKVYSGIHDIGPFYFSSYAQDISDRLHFNVDWQMNAPLNTNFADKISGWGMNLEGGYFLTPHWSRRLSLISIQIINCSASNHN